MTTLSKGNFGALLTVFDRSNEIGDYPAAVRPLQAVSLWMELHAEKWTSCVLHGADFARSAPRQLNKFLGERADDFVVGFVDGHPGS